jgi:hopanoid biosynthesis associated RND transporter like protein HpnN
MKIKRLKEDSFVAHTLAALANAIFHHRRLFVYPQLALFVFCCFYTYRHLEFDMNQDHLVGANKKYHQNFLRFKKEFPTQDDLVVVAESDDPEKNRQFIERLGPRLEREMVKIRLTNGTEVVTNLFHDVMYKPGDLRNLGRKGLLFASESDLKDLDKTLKDFLPFIQQFTAATNLISFFDMINTRLRTATEEKNAENDALVNALPALQRIVEQARDNLDRPGRPPSPGVFSFFDPTGEAEQQIYITFAKGRIFILTAQAPTEDLNDEAVIRLRALVEETRPEVPGINIGLTGEPVLDHDQMSQSQKDATLASIVSLLLCAIIFIYGYQETGRPVKATLCLVVGLGYTLAFATFAVGHLNILTVTFVPILIGLAIDYGVHLISRFEEELRRGRPEQEALAKAMIYTGQGILTGAFTTAGAFLAMMFTNFKGIQEMGEICGGGLLICVIPMMTMLPVLLLRGRQNVIDHQQGDLALKRARIENLWLERPVLVSFITVVLCALAATQLPKTYFDYDLLNLQSAGLPSVEFEKELIAADKSVLYGAVIASNLQEAASLERQLTNLPAVSGLESLTRYLTEDQSGKLQMVADIKRTLAPLKFALPDPSPVNIPELSRTLYSLYGYLGAAHEEVGTNQPGIDKQLLSLRDGIGELRKAMLSGDELDLETNSLELAEFQQVFFDDVRETFAALQNQDDSSPLGIADLPQALRDRFVGVTGKFLLMVYPKKDLWNRDNQKEFITQVRQVDPYVTGTPVQLYEYTTLLKTSYEQAARYALVAIVFLVLFHFRSPLAVALSLVPVGVGFLWLNGILGYFHIPLNPANIMTLPLVVGIGVTNGIHILNRFAEEQTPNILARSTGKAVLVSGLTAIAGFGSLILGKHRGMQSLGYVMSIGLAACMIAGLTFLPALLNLLVRMNLKTKRPSIDNARSTLGREEPR